MLAYEKHGWYTQLSYAGAKIALTHHRGEIPGRHAVGAHLLGGRPLLAREGLRAGGGNSAEGHTGSTCMPNHRLSARAAQRAQANDERLLHYQTEDE